MINGHTRFILHTILAVIVLVGLLTCATFALVTREFATAFSLFALADVYSYVMYAVWGMFDHD